MGMVQALSIFKLLTLLMLPCPTRAATAVAVSKVARLQGCKRARLYLLLANAAR